MTTDSLKAALEQRAKEAASQWRIPCSTDPRDESLCAPKDDCIWGYEQGYLAALRASTDAAPVAYMDRAMLERRSEFERNGAVVYDRPLGCSTMPLYAHLPVPDAAGDGSSLGEPVDIGALRQMMQRVPDPASVAWQHIVPPSKPANELATAAVRSLPNLLNELEALRAALAQPPAAELVTGIDVETAAWAWLEKKFGTESDDPVDRAYDASEMVDAFHAGSGRRPTPAAEPVGMREADGDYTADDPQYDLKVRAEAYDLLRAKAKAGGFATLGQALDAALATGNGGEGRS